MTGTQAETAGFPAARRDPIAGTCEGGHEIGVQPFTRLEQVPTRCPFSPCGKPIAWQVGRKRVKVSA